MYEQKVCGVQLGTLNLMLLRNETLKSKVVTKEVIGKDILELLNLKYH